MPPKFIDWLISKLMDSLGWIASILPLPVRGMMGSFLGELMYVFGSSRRRITMNNLRIAFPNKSIAERQRICKRSFVNLGITFLEVAALKYFSEDDIRKLIQLKNHVLINETIARGNGAILLSGHYSNWEFIAMIAGLMSGVPITIVVKRQKNKYLDQKIENVRKKYGNRTVEMRHAARELLGAVARNEAIALLVDQSAQKDKDVFVNFFGVDALTYRAPAELALRRRIPILYAFATRNPDFTYTAELKELDFSDLEYSKENVVELTRRHVKVLEEQITIHPEFWAWQHRRWKHIIKY